MKAAVGGNNGNKACAEGLVGADNCQRIIGLHDRISAAQAASTQGFAHNEESSHERGKEYRDQGSLFTYAPNGGEVEPQHQHHDRERERDLAKKDPRYKHVSKQEFGHMLLAIQDLLQYIYEETRENPEERQELYNFIHMIKG